MRSSGEKTAPRKRGKGTQPPPRGRSQAQHARPSATVKQYWLEAQRKSGQYPEHTDQGGKWLIFVPSSEIDKVWQEIKLAVEAGKLGDNAKVSTAKPNPNSADPTKHVICVYTYDATDIDDVMRIRQQLRKLGIVLKIPYKTDNATISGRYEKNGHKHISQFYE